MEVKREVYIAIGVAILMILICIFLFFSGKEETVEVLDINVYKLYKLEDEGFEYRECHISTEDKQEINDFFKKVVSFSDDKALKGSGINGDYKIVSGDNFIAFDYNDNNSRVYNANKNLVYEYPNEIYEKIINYCEG